MEIKLVLNPDLIEFLWVCNTVDDLRLDGCRRTARVSYADIASNGTPLCPDCDTEMELAEKGMTTLVLNQGQLNQIKRRN
jgi:hypothetical protein